MLVDENEETLIQTRRNSR